MKVLLAHPGTQYSHRLALELNRMGALTAFHTGLAFAAGGLADRCAQILANGWSRRLANRRIDGLPPERLHCHPFAELGALLQLQHGGGSQEVIHRRNERFQRAIPAAALASVDAVIGFDTSSWILAKRCAKAGVPLIVDQSIGHPDAKREVYEQVKRRFPDWVEGIEARLPEVREAEELEHRMANGIVAASSFTRRTLIENGVSADKIRVNPYGVDCSKFEMGRRDEARPFRFVFVGAINARKGIPLLLKAWEALSAMGGELWLVGPVSKPVANLIPCMAGLRCIGAVPHGEMPAVLKQCDVLVFPSYFEGFGLVILEAMACGLPVITTTATAGPDIITHGQDGWIIEPDNLEGLIEIMNDCVPNRGRVSEMGRRARSTAEKLTWLAYGDRWVQTLQEVCDGYRDTLGETQ